MLVVIFCIGEKACLEVVHGHFVESKDLLYMFFGVMKFDDRHIHLERLEYDCGGSLFDANLRKEIQIVDGIASAQARGSCHPTIWLV
jgi:hypothetical protein